ncbi:unnamed protein product, partial [Rotaria sp. Silwood2]
FYQRQYFSSPNIKQISLDLTSIDDEQLDQKKSTPDLTKIYYELQEQRHIQPLHIYEQIEQKQETSDDNLNNPVQQIDLTSFSQISNLSSREYHQVFGVSNEIVNTVNDSTNYIDQIIPSNVSDEVKSITFDSNEKSQITEIFEDNRSIVSENQEQLNNESMPNIISNAEFDFRYSSLLNRLDTLAKPLLNLPLSSSIIANELTLSKTHQEKDTYDHLNERYDVLIDHVNTLDAAIHASPIIKMTDIDKQVTTFSSDDQHNELMNNRSSLSDEISHTTPQYPTTDTEIISTFNIIESTDTFKNPTAELPDGKTTITLSNPLKIESNIVSNQLPGHYDDYPWYSSYYTIAQAETKLGQLYKQLNFVDEQNRSSSRIEFHEILSSHDHELQNEQDQDNDEEGFHIVHRRKRIPSSTTHTNILPSIIVPTKLPISSDIDLEPVILHGHSTAPAITASITPQTINISSKTKHKKKKKEKSEVIFFDAPELISSDSNKQQIDATQSELVQQEFPVNNETINSSQTHRTITHECEQLQPTSNVISNEQQQPEVLSTLTSSNIDELKLVADNKNELTSNGVSSLSSTLVKMPSDENLVNTQTIEQQSIDKESNQQSAPSFTMTSISSMQQISIDDHKQQDDTTSKPGYQDLQVLYDDNQSNSNYNTIADAETTKLDHLNEELNLANEQNRSPTTADFHETPSTDNHELESVKNQDDDEDFHIVHHRKRIPSSTTHAKTLPSTTIVTQSTLSSDIDLEPVILHGHPTAPTTTSPTVSETTNIPSKTRHKKKKKDKTEMAFFDAPQLISSNLDKQKTDIAPSELVKQEDTVNIGTMNASQLNQITKDECEPSPAISSVISDEQQQQQQPIALSTLITSNIDELKQVADNKHELTCNNVSPLSSAPVTIPADEIKVHTQSIEQQSKEKPSILQSVPSSITTTLSSIQQTTVDDQEQEDDTANESSYEELQVLYDDYPWYSSYYAIADAEEKIAHLYKPLKHVDQQSCFSATVKTHETLIIQKHELESEKDQDNDDEFHVVHRRKRIPSSTTQTKTLPSATMTTKPPTSPDIDLEPVILHGHPAAPTITSPIVSETTNIPSKTKHKKKKKDTTEMIFFDAPELTSPDAKKEKIHDKQSALVEQAHQVNIETMDSSQLNRIIASEYEQLESTPTDISDVRQQPEVSSTLTISNADELELVADNKKELTSTDVSLLSSTLVTIPSDQIIVNIEQNRSPTIADYHERPFPHDHELENVKDENDDEGDFHIVHRRKRIPSSTAHAKTLPSSTKTTASTLSSDIDLEPVILHGHPTAPTTTSPIVSKIMDTPSKTKHKKKKDKTEMIFFDAPELTSLDANNQKSDVAQSQLIEQEHPANIETIDSSEISETITGEHKQLESTSTDISTEQKQIEVLSPLITSNIDVLKPIADEENEKTGTGLMQSSSIPFTTFPEELDVGSQSIEQQSMDAESIQQCLRISPDIEVVSQPVVGQEKQADSEEFQDAHHCKHATSPPRSRTPPQSSSFTNSIDGQNISPDIDRKPVVIHGPHDSASRSIPRTTVAAETASTSTDQSTEPGDKVVTSKVADSAVVISTRSDAIVTEVEAAHQEQSSFTGLPAIMQDVLSPVIEVKTAPSCNLLDNATSFETNDTPTLTSTLFTSEPSEKDISLVNTHSLNVQIIPSELNTPVKDVTTTVQGVVETTHKNILPTQDEITSIPEHSLISTYASDSPSFQITDTEHTRLSSTLQTSVEDRKQQDELMNKPSCEKVEVFYDDYPWYLSYYTIADAETKLGTLYRRSYSFNEQNYLLTRVDVHEKLSSHDNEIQNEKDIDDHDDEFHVVHRRKRIPSSTTHTKILPSTAITTKTSISSDIDLEPVILHGHPTAPTITNPIVSETTNIPSKTKHKKKKKDKTEMIFFDAPELISSHAKKEKIHDTQSALVEQEHPSNIETMDSSQLHQTIASAYETLHSTSTEISNEQKQPEVLSALSTSNIDELKPVADNKNELISNDVSVLPSALVTIPSDEITGNTEQNRSPATADFHETPSTDDRELENVKNEDDEGFHIVHRRKRIPSSTTHAKTLPSTTISTESTLSSDIDLEPVIIHGHPTAPTITSPIVSETTNIPSKTKHKKKKKDTTEMILFDAPELTSPDAKKEKIHDKQSALVEQAHPVNIETMDSSQLNRTIASEYEQLESTPTDISDARQQPEVLSTLTTSNADELELVADNKKELTSADVSLLSSTLVRIPSDQIIVNIEQNRSPTIADYHERPSPHDHELENVKDEDDDEGGFHIVHRRKRIPSSTAHAKTLPSSTITTESTLSSDIDLEPVILHGHPTAPTISSPIVSETTNIPSKTKHKKRKKEKSEVIFFDAPELISSDPNKQKIDDTQSEILQQALPVNIETLDSSQINERIKQECVQSQSASSEISNEKDQPEVLSTVTTSSTNKLEQKADNENEITSSDVSQLSSTPVRIVSEEEKVDMQSIEQQPIDKQAIMWSSATSEMTTRASADTELVSQSAREEEEQEDNEGFQVVHHLKHITSAPRSRKIQQSSSTTNTIYGQNISPDIDLKPVVIHGRNDSASRSIPRRTAINETASTSTSQFAKSGDKLVTSNITDNEVVISRPSEEIVPELDVAVQEQSSIIGLFEIMKDIVSAVPQKIIVSLEPTDKTTHSANTSSSVEEHTPADVPRSGEEITSTIKTTIVTSEGIRAKEEQQLSSTGLFDKVKNLLPATSLPNTSSETTSEAIQQIVKSQQQEDTTEEFVDANDSSTVQNLLSISPNLMTNAARKQDYPTKDRPIPAEEERHTVFDLVVQAVPEVKEIISNLGSTQEGPDLLQASSNLLDKSLINTLECGNLYNDKEQQTFIATVKEVVEAPQKNISPIQEQKIPIPEHSLISTYPSDSYTFQNTNPKRDTLSSGTKTSPEHYKQQTEIVNKPSNEKLQLIYDDYPWYSSYYTIADAEAKLGTFYIRLYSFNEQNRSLTTVDVHQKHCTNDHELQNGKDIPDNDDGFHVVHRRKRTPSSTTHTKTLPSTTITMESTLSSDIDLEPVIIHGHPTAPTISSPIVSETANIPSKTKHKKKKKDKTEMIFFDAPELTSPDAKKEKIHDTQSTLVEQEHSVNIETMDSSQLHQTIASAYEPLHSTSTEISNEQKQPEVLSALITSNIDELKPVADNKNELISNDVSVVPSTLVTMSSDEIIVNTEQNRSPATADFHETPSTDDRELENIKNEDDDEEGFHIVHRRKRIPSSTTHAKTLPSTAITTESTLSADIDLEPVIIHGHPTAPTISSPIVSETTNISSKTKHKKKKKDKTEMIFFDAPELTSPDAKKEKIHDKQSALVEQEHPVNIETMDSSQRTQRIASEYEQLEPTPTERSNEQQPEVLSTLTASNIDELKLVADNKNELTSNDVSPLSSTLVTIPSDQITSNTETSERQSIDKEPVQQSSPPFTTTDISSIQKIPIDDHKQQDDTTSKPLYQDLQAPYDDYQLHPTCYSIADAETKLAESNQQLNLVNEQNRSPSIADFHETPSTDDRELESVKDEDNDDGTFHIVHRRKRIPSSTTHAQTLPSTAIIMESTLSADIDLEPVILHGHPTSP